MSKKKYYSPEFKQEAVRLAEASGNRAADRKSQRGRPAVARDLGIHATVIGKWQRQLRQGGESAFPGKGKPRDEEMFQLKKENRRLQQELGRRAVDILKKAVGGSRAVSLQFAPRKISICPEAFSRVFRHYYV